jgi:hypothetical protein
MNTEQDVGVLQPRNFSTYQILCCIFCFFFRWWLDENTHVDNELHLSPFWSELIAFACCVVTARFPLNKTLNTPQNYGLCMLQVENLNLAMNKLIKFELMRDALFVNNSRVVIEVHEKTVKEFDLQSVVGESHGCLMTLTK